jgi:hypothetical protein
MMILSCNFWTTHARNIDSSLHKYRIQISSVKKAIALIDYRLENQISIPHTGRNSLQKMYDVSDITLRAGPTLMPMLPLREAALYHK